MNKVILVGRLARDPELRTTNSGKSVATFSLAVDRRYKQDDGPEADFFNVVAWGKTAEVICQYLSKGRQIAVEGRLQQRSYTNQNGEKRYVVEVVLEAFDFIGGRNDHGTSQQTNAYGNSSGQRRQEPVYQQGEMPMEFDIDPDFQLIAEDDEVPF